MVKPVKGKYLNYITEGGWGNLGLTASSKPAVVIRDARPDMIIQTRQNMKACLKGYVLTGWFGNMPKACENNYVAGGLMRGMEV